MNLKDLQSIIDMQNNAPQADFCGLSANEVHTLLYDDIAKPPVALKKVDDDVLDQAPLFRLAEALTEIVVREGNIKLTPLGALPKKVLVELYAQGFVKENDIESGLTKLWKEDDTMSVSNCRYSLEAAGILKVTKGRLILTLKGKKLLKPGMRNELFKEFLHALMTRLDWGYFDGYPRIPVGQIGWKFTVYLLLKFGAEERAASFYAIKYKTAFPAMQNGFPTDSFTTADELFNKCFVLRSFHRCMLWLGMIRIVKSAGFLSEKDDFIVKSELLNKLFDID